jgi:hypothetical protein
MLAVVAVLLEVTKVLVEQVVAVEERTLVHQVLE